MAKSKSSASSATRKKHASKSSKGDEESQSTPNQPNNGQQQRGQKNKQTKKTSRFEPKIKSYIPPPPPPKGLIDPVDLYLLNTSGGSVGASGSKGKNKIDSELIVILRKLNKRDESTLLKGLDGFENWFKEVLELELSLVSSSSSTVVDGDDEEDKEEQLWKLNLKVEELTESMNVWAHHLPRLILHPSRRIRLQSTSLSALFLSPPSSSPSSPSNKYSESELLKRTRSKLLEPQWIENQDFISCLILSMFDGDRGVSSFGKKVWEGVCLLPKSGSSDVDGDENMEEAEERAGIDLVDSASMILDFTSSLILAPSPPPISPTTITNSSSNQSPEEPEQEDQSPRKTQSLQTLSYLLTTLPLSSLQSLSSPPSHSLDFLRSKELWNLLDRETNQLLASSVRRSLYELLGSIVNLNGIDLLASPSPLANDGNEAEDEDEEDNEEEDGITIVSERVLLSCWEEKDCWAGVIAFLRRYPQAWTLANDSLASTIDTAPILTKSIPVVVEEDEKDEEDEDNTSCPPPFRSSSPSPPSPLAAPFIPSPILSLFLTHLNTACSSHPINYPTILLLLSTIPPTLLPLTKEANTLLFQEFWKGASSRGLIVGMLGGGGGNSSGAGGKTAVEEFIGSFLECLLWQSAALLRSDSLRSLGIVEELMVNWLGGKVWRTYLGLRTTEAGDGEGEVKIKGFNTIKVGRLIEGMVGKLAARKEESLFDKSWASIILYTTTLINDLKSSESLPILSSALKTFYRSPSAKVSTAAKELSVESIRLVIIALGTSEDLSRSEKLFGFVESLRSVVGKGNVELTEILNTFSISNGATLLSSPSSTPSSSTALLKFLSSQISSVSLSSANLIWSSLFIHPLPASALLSLIEVVERGEIRGEKELESAGIDNLIMEMCLRVLAEEGGSDSKELDIVKKLCVKPHPFVNSDTPALLISLATFRLQELTFTLPITSTASLNSTIQLIRNYTKSEKNAHHLLEAEAGVLEIFEVAEGLLDANGVKNEDARAAWHNLIKVGEDSLAKKTMDKIRRHLLDTASLASTTDVVNAAASLVSNLSAHITLSLASLLPTPSTFDSLYTSLRLSPPSSALSILDSLIQLSSEDDDDSSASNLEHFDSSGLNSYARAVLAILEISARDHTWTRSNIWILPHILLLGNVARDELALAGSTSGMFSKSVDSNLLESLVTATDGLTSYILSFVANGLSNDWQASTIATLRSKVPPVEMFNDLVGVLDVLARRGRNSDDVYSRRAFSTILKATLRYTEASLQDADRWLAFAQGLTEGSELACAILSSIKSILFETPRFERYQNELASTLAGIPSSAASERGVRVLRVLLSTAPPLDAPIIFLPQQRTMFLIQRMQTWISSEDDLVDEINTMMAELFLHLAPIVQELSGSHWDLIFDIIESNLETADWNDKTSLPALYHSARLLEEIKDLASSNAELRVTAKGRIDTSLELVRDLFVSRPSTSERNQPKAIILESLARLVRDLPPKLLTMGSSFDQLLRLLQDPSMAVQHSSYNLVSRIADKYVTDLVVEAELDGDTVGVIQLPLELIALISNRLPFEISQETNEYYKASTYLLAWLTVFSFFDKASPRIKSAYIDQLRANDIVSSSLLPSIFSLIGLSDRSRPFDMSPWAIDEYRLDLIDELDSTNLAVLASFVYYRSLQALPSLVRLWWEACRNRQLSMAVASMTSRHFSPVLIASELAHLRDPDDPAGKALRDNEDFTVKVAGGANEVKAVFVIDEQNMEILIKLPNEFPLVGVEVKDIRKVGVSDSQWRAWLLAVQQVVSAQNSSIADGLSLFKRNVSGHFEGIEACAICYSIIHVIDRSKPTKDCNTCHNKFHAACLYKWFTSSHSSTCPMCRSSEGFR